MANDPLVYAIDSDGTLAAIDLTTGATTIIGKPSTPLSSIAFNPAGQLYGSDGTSLHTVNSVTGATTKVGNFGGSIPIYAIRFAPDGTLYGDASVTTSSNPQVSGNQSNLYSIDPTSGTASLIGSRQMPYEISGVGPLAFVGGELDQFYTGAPGPNVGDVAINPSNGQQVGGGYPGFNTLFPAPGGGVDNVTNVGVNSISASGTQMQVVALTGATLNNVGSVASPMESAPQSTFYIQDNTTGRYKWDSGSAYAGPVTGLTSEFVTNTSDILNVTSFKPSTFIEVGYLPGQQTQPTEGGINVSLMNGNNVLDGYAGSNFLTGGTGADTFYVDDRTLTQNSWSTVVNFHAGDGVTMWGVTPQDFTTTVLDGQGATGFTGVTIIFSASGKPAAAVTLTGYTSADLINGRLDVSYGTTPDTSGAPGANYMHIQGY